MSPMNAIKLSLVFRKAAGVFMPKDWNFGIVDQVLGGGDRDKTNEILEGLTTTGAAKNALGSLFSGPR